MSTTLTNGLKLPDKGSVDWYADMQNNYQILDGAVGTVAEHTSALSGKAPLVHTHSKADITNLFNSANEWTNTQTYSAGYYGQMIWLKNTDLDLSVNGNTGLSSAYQHIISWVDKNETAYSLVQSWTSNSENVLVLRSRYRTDANTVKDLSVRFASTATNKVVYPESNGDTDLGTSTKQWNNLYAQSYYYNGVAWGLDKANTWSNINTYQREICISGDRDAYIAPMREGASSGIAFLNSDATKTFVFGQYTTDANNRKAIDSTKGRLLIRTGERNGETVIDFEPRATNAILGTSANKWKTLNGINPGALSLPDISDADPISTNNWVGDNSSSNQYTPTENGWIYFRIEGANKNITIRYGGAGGDAPSITSESTISHLSVFFPVRSGVTMYIFFNGTMVKAFFYPCLGNV